MGKKTNQKQKISGETTTYQRSKEENRDRSHATEMKGRGKELQRD